MSIQVRCPNGCSISLPGKKKGKLVECSECHSTIRIPRLAELVDGRPLFEAKLIAEPGELEPTESKTDATTPSVSPSEMVNAPQHHRKTSSKQTEPASDPKKTKSPESNPFEFLAAETSTPAVEMSEILPLIVDQNAESDSVSGEVVIELDQNAKHVSKYDPERDRVWLTRFYSVCLLMVGLVNCVPVVVFSIAYNQQIWDSVLPRWAFVLIFLSMTIFAYSVYLMQLTDWTSLMIVAFFVLLVACAYGFIAAGLWLGNSNGLIAQALQLPHSYYHFGPIWGGIMFCLSVLASFTFGRDALIWQRNSSSRQFAG